MGKISKIFSFVLAVTIATVFVGGNSFADEFIILSTPEETCEYFIEGCEFSGEKVILTPSEQVEISKPIIFQIKELEIDGGKFLTSEDFSGDFLWSFGNESRVILNSLDVVASPKSVIIDLGMEATLEANGGNYQGCSLIEAGESSSAIFRNVNADLSGVLVENSYHAKEITFDGGIYRTTYPTLFYLQPSASFLVLNAGEFSSASNDETSSIFRIYAPESEEDVKILIEDYVPDTSYIFDVEHNTETAEYGILDLQSKNDNKGTFVYGVISSSSIEIKKKEGLGSIEEEPEPETTEKIEEEIETESVPDTAADKPYVYLIVVILTSFGFLLSFKKYLGI